MNKKANNYANRYWIATEMLKGNEKLQLDPLENRPLFVPHPWNHSLCSCLCWCTWFDAVDSSWCLQSQRTHYISNRKINNLQFTAYTLSEMAYKFADPKKKTHSFLLGGLPSSGGVWTMRAGQNTLYRIFALSFMKIKFFIWSHRPHLAIWCILTKQVH